MELVGFGWSGTTVGYYRNVAGWNTLGLVGAAAIYACACKAVGLNKCLEVIINIWLFTMNGCQPMGGIVVIHLLPLAVAHATHVRFECTTR